MSLLVKKRPVSHVENREEARIIPAEAMDGDDLRVSMQKRLGLTIDEIDSLLFDSGGYKVAHTLLRKNGLSEEALREKRYEFALFQAGLLTMDDLEKIRAFRRGIG